MKSLYCSPLRVYLCLGFLALVGIVAGSQLPVSLFPNSSKPKIVARIPYGSLNAEEFLNLYGRGLENGLQSISTDLTPIEKLESHYDQESATFTISFKWGCNPQAAQKEVERIVNTASSRFPDEARLGTDVWQGNDNVGFISISFYSETRSLDEIYDIIEPILVPKLSKIPDAAQAELWNPTKKEVRVELQPGKMAALQILPSDVSHAISDALKGQNGGAMTVATQQLGIQMPKSIRRWDDLNQVLIPTPSGRIVHLADAAKVDYTLKTTDTRSFKTSGAPSLILYADPKPGGNVKKMAEGVIDAVTESMPLFPKDIRYEILVDPSEFINSAIHNVLREVALGALLAVAVLFLFIGSFKNTITAAVEIPLSMILAFIMMRLSGMNLNLISLGGLALSAGMNVDASVVVMENIFRHFDFVKTKLTFQERLEIIIQAVSEVKFAVVASTISSLVVFLPLAFTSDLSYAILGDLAKTVVFSHGFSAFVALILVPTVRLQLMGKGGGKGSTKGSNDQTVHSPIEPQIIQLESRYARALGSFIANRRVQRNCYLGLTAILILMLVLVLPRLPRDIIGNPDTDWMYVSINTRGNTLVKQMESRTEEIESDFLKKMGEHVRYTFTQIRGPNRSSIMARLKDKGEMKSVWKQMETLFSDTPFVKYSVGPWNPAELPIPNPPQIQLSVRGGELKDRVLITRQLRDLFEEHQVLPRIWSDPNVDRSENIILRPNLQLWPGLKAHGISISPDSLADLTRVATHGRRVDSLVLGGKTTDIFLRYPDGMIQTPEDLGALPIGIDAKIIPLKALAQVSVEEEAPAIYRVDQRETFSVFAKQNESEKGSDSSAAIKTAHELVEKWKSENKAMLSRLAATITFEDAEKDIHEALVQLGYALGLSILMIFMTLLIQFGNLINALLVLVAVPLGLIGALASLFIFRSTLSLNSILGVILLNGIAVANSIILVDFMKKLVDQGMSPAEAAVMAGKKRLRPILITSLTTILGMLPIALGIGEGGKVLQPLGITVSGGLWVSMALTLFVVPALQVRYLGRKLSVLIVLAACLATTVSAQAKEIPLPFDAALTQILARSTAVQTQEATLGSTQAGAVPSRFAFVPSLSLDAKTTRAGVPGQTFGADRQVEVLSQYNLFHWGADLAALRAGNEDIHSQTASLENSRLSTEDSGVVALVAEIQRRKEIEINQEIANIQTKLLSIARERYAGGYLSLQEVNKISVDLNNANASLSDSQLQETVSRAQLENLLGHSDIELQWPWKERLEKSGTKILAEHWDVKERPDWQAAQSSDMAELERYHRSLRLLLPSLDANFAYGYYTGPGTIAGPQGSPAWSTGLSVTLPLFDHLVTYSNMRVQSYREKVADIALVQTERDAKSSLDTARDSFRIALGAAIAREKTLDISRQLYQDSLKRFQVGRISANDLVVDQRRLLDSEFFAVQGWSNVHVQFPKLCHAYGRRLERCWKD